ncbi:MAG: response regulator [Halovenus sp.]
MATDVSVLIVDDELDTADVYGAHLEDEYDVSIVNSGDAALETADSGTDVVLLDRRMPDTTGDEVLAQLRDRGFDGRVIMVTAVDPDIDIIEMAFDEYLVKPVTGAQLRDAVERMLARDTLEAKVEEMFAVASKLAALESKLQYDQLQESEEYEALLTEFMRLREETDLPDSVDDQYLEATLEKMEALLTRDRT